MMKDLEKSRFIWCGGVMHMSSYEQIKGLTDNIKLNKDKVFEEIYKSR